MRRKTPFSCILFIFAIVFCSCNGKHNSTSQAEQGESLCFLDTIHDFGTLPHENPIDSFDYRFVNNTAHPVVVLSTRPSCDCTRADYPHSPVLPGDTSHIRVIYDGRGRGGEYFSKTVTVVTSASFDEISLVLTGETR